MKRNADVGYLILRVALGILMLLHGMAKLENGLGSIENTLANAGIPAAFSWLVYLGEIVAPLMLIFGFRTRKAGLLLAATMLVVMLVAFPHRWAQRTPVGAWALELQALFLFGGIAQFFTGGGRYALSTKSRWD